MKLFKDDRWSFLNVMNLMNIKNKFKKETTENDIFALLYRTTPGPS